MGSLPQKMTDKMCQEVAENAYYQGIKT